MATSIRPLVAARRFVWRSGGTWESSRVLRSAPIADRAVGLLRRPFRGRRHPLELRVGRAREVGRLLALERHLDDRVAARDQDVLVDAVDQRLARRASLDRRPCRPPSPPSSTRRGSGRASRRGRPSRALTHLLAGRGRHRHEERVQARVVGQLGVEGADEHAVLARDDGMAVDLGEHLDARRRGARSRARG